MSKRIWVSFISLLMLAGHQVMAQSSVDIQGHRGCRGLMPENTVPAFLKAVELGVTTLEMDVVISADKQIVISHEPWMSHVICSHPKGGFVTKKEAKSLNLYLMNYEEIQTFDCGMRVHPDFPHQQKLYAIKPTLKMVVRSVERFAADKQYTQPLYNIEIKSGPKGYDVFTPKPAVFVDMVVNEVRRLGIESQTTLQSFDVNVLEALFKTSSRQFRIAYLVEKGKNIQKNLTALSFKPDIYSPSYKLVDEKTVKDAHDAGIKIIPWTVNTKEEMKRLISMNVDGIISDYPDVAKSLDHTSQ